MNKKPTKKSVLLAIFVTFCMILSTSGQAYLYGGILWLIFILKCFKKYLTKKNERQTQRNQVKRKEILPS